MNRFSRVLRYDEVDSTNRVLVDLARAGETSDVVAVANYQHAGRGRLGRRWVAPAGSALLLSVLIDAQEVENQGWATQALALSVIDACALCANVNATAKWPNDVLIGDRKVAGILAERVETGNGVARIVMGCGVNNTNASYLRDEVGSESIALEEVTDAPLSLEIFEVALLAALAERLARPAWLIDAFRSRCSTIGRLVTIETAQERFKARAVAVEDDGALRVERLPNGESVVISAGDVRHAHLVK